MSARLKVFTMSAMVTLVGPTLTAGCGDDAPKASSRGAGGPARPKPAAAGPVRGAGPDLSALPTKFQNAKWDSEPVDPQRLREARDPFRPYVDDLVPKKPEKEDDPKTTAPEGVVSDSEVTELQLIAVITGAAVAKAMLTDGRGLGHMLRVGDIVGLKEPYRVARITRNEVLFRPLRSNPDEPLEDVTKVLLTQDELQELRP